MTLKNLLIPLVDELSSSKNGKKKTLQLSDGTVFKGTVEDGYLAGKDSKITWTNGNQYQGEFQENRPHGIGSFTWYHSTLLKV